MSDELKVKIRTRRLFVDTNGLIDRVEILDNPELASDKTFRTWCASACIDGHHWTGFQDEKPPQCPCGAAWKTYPRLKVTSMP